ncbi:hypothetical protein K439DRAFT_1341358, partial [Ramaria rubella]
SLFYAAQCLCKDVALQKNEENLISHFSTIVAPEALEHGDPLLAPFLGRKFVGIHSLRSYFELLSQSLTYRNMRFGEYIIDVDERKVVVKGWAEFTWKSTNESWEETFVYVLDFDERNKVKRYQVWADSGAAHLASVGSLSEKRKEVYNEHSRHL